MSFTPTRLKTLGAAILGTLAFGACDDPVAGTDLRPEGNPEVLAVLVFNDTVDGAVEAATYCKPNDPKRPGKVGIPAYGIAPVICPLELTQAQPELTDAWPDMWYVRIMFDELLDPEVETLEPILDATGADTGNFSGSLATTQPVSLQCQDVRGNFVDVDYDGYYSPSGNSVTWPLGPSLVIKPLDPTVVPVESECQVSIKASVHDKDGNSVSEDDRKAFKFKLAPISVIGVSPGEGSAVDPAVNASGGLEVALDFNVEIDTSASFCSTPGMAGCFSITNKGGENPGNQNVSLGDHSLTLSADFLGGQTYTFTPPADFKLKDKCGKESTVVGKPDAFDFDTNPARLISFNPGGGDAVAPSKKILLNFNQRMDLTTFKETEDFEISDPKPNGFGVAAAGGGTLIRLTGDYKLDTIYKLTIKKGASISDSYGKQAITFAEDRIVQFKTDKDIKITAQSPANGARVVKAPTANGRITLTFNQEMDPTSLDPAEISLTKADGTAVSGPVITASGAALRIDYAALPAGTYKFTLKRGAQINDKPTIGDSGVFTQPPDVDRVINFTVADAPTSSGTAFKCLGQ